MAVVGGDHGGYGWGDGMDGLTDRRADRDGVRTPDRWIGGSDRGDGGTVSMAESLLLQADSPYWLYGILANRLSPPYRGI